MLNPYTHTVASSITHVHTRLLNHFKNGKHGQKVFQKNALDVVSPRINEDITGSPEQTADR